MKLRFMQKNQVEPGVYSFIFDPEQQIHWQPGQYMHYVLPHPDADDRGTERWFTVSAAPYEDHPMLTTRMTNDKGSSFKKALMQLQPGDEVEADEPKGSFVLKEGDHKHVLIAGGIGITPYRSMLAELAHEGKPANADLLYANSDDDLVFGDELEEIARKDPSLKIIKFIGKRITEADLAPYVAEENTIFYLSGPRAMVELYEAMLKKLGVDEECIMTDYFPGY